MDGLDGLDGLASLVGRSLLQVLEQPGGEPRFRMLETIREYALEQLEASGEALVVRRKHAEYFLWLAQQAEPQLTGPQQADWLARLEAEHDNLRAALQCLLENGEPSLALRIAGAVYWFWLMRGYLAEGRRWLDAALAAAEPTASAARALGVHGAGVLAWNQRDLAAARALLQEALGMRRALGDMMGSTRTLANLAVVVNLQDGAGRALPIYQESLELFRELGDRRGEANTLNNLALAVRDAGDLPRAQAYLEECLALRRELGDDAGAARALVNLGLVACRRGKHEEARASLHEGLRLAEVVGMRDIVAYALEGLADVAIAHADAARAAWLLGAAAGLRERIGAPALTAGDQEDIERRRATARAQCGDRQFVTRWEAGRAAEMEEAITVGLALGAASSAGPAATSLPPLTRREREVAVLVARGLPNRQIADQLVITEGTAEQHVVHILNKLGFHSRTQVAAWAVEYGILSSPTS